MNSPAVGFNLILTILVCACACNTPKKHDTTDKEEPKEATLLHFHVESNADPTGRTMQVPVFRSRPVLVTVQREPVLDEGFLKKVELVDADETGGYAIKVTFDDAGTRRLDDLTVEHRGLHLAINAVWTESRWLGAPLLTKRISNGEFVFTPDATREEAERIIKGLEHVIKRLHQTYTF